MIELFTQYGDLLPKYVPKLLGIVTQLVTPRHYSLIIHMISFCIIACHLFFIFFISCM